jgi:HSP20 family molecular chaperone IbpA
MSGASARFERYFGVPEGADTGKIEATFKKGVPAVTLPTGETSRRRKRQDPVLPGAG